jgi:hypothetical protein
MTSLHFRTALGASFFVLLLLSSSAPAACPPKDDWQGHGDDDITLYVWEGVNVMNVKIEFLAPRTLNGEGWGYTTKCKGKTARLVAKACADAACNPGSQPLVTEGTSPLSRTPSSAAGQTWGAKVTLQTKVCDDGNPKRCICTCEYVKSQAKGDAPPP